MVDVAVVEELQRFLKESVICGDELEKLLLKAVNITYWQNLNSQLAVSHRETADAIEAVPILPQQEVLALDCLARHGHFGLPPLFQSKLIVNMRNCVDTVRSAGWPSVFTFLYDEFWAVFQNAAMVGLLRKYLGEYNVTANVWTYYVRPNYSGIGWPPHVDGWDDQGWLTVWIPLTDASVENGCIYIIARDSLPQSLPKHYQEWKNFDVAELSALLHGVRPLPAKAGSVLGWDHQLIHWGGRASDTATEPRISIALAFVSETITPTNSELPVTRPGVLPDFTTRLKIVGKAILDYQKFEPLVSRYDLLAKRLIDG